MEACMQTCDIKVKLLTHLLDPIHSEVMQMFSKAPFTPTPSVSVCGCACYLTASDANCFTGTLTDADEADLHLFLSLIQHEM